MANNGRKPYRLGDVTENFDSVRIPVKKPDRKSGLYPYYGASGVVDHVDKYIFDGEYLLIAEDGENLRSHKLPIAFMATGKFWVNNHAHIVKGNRLANTRYLGHILNAIDISGYLSGSTMPKLTQGSMNRIQLQLPDKAIQDAIVDFMQSLERKEAVNRRMNRTLEKMAAALFKSWFIDFDPVHAKAEGRDPALPQEIADLIPDSFEDSQLGEIPMGWDVKPLDEIADYLNGLACQKHPPVEGQKSLPVIKIRELRQGITGNTDRASVDVPSKYIVEDGDILFSWSGSLLVTIWCGGRGVLNQHVFKVTSTNYPKWFFYQATKHHLDEFQRIASDKATTMGHIQRRHLTSAKVAVPAKKLMEKGTEVLDTMLDRQINGLKQAHILALTRDTLLPKLLGGEIELPDAEGIAAEVTT